MVISYKPVHVTIQIKAVENAIDYRAQITRDAQAQQDVVAEVMAQILLRNSTTSLMAIIFAARVTAFDANRLEGLPAILGFTVKGQT